MHYLAISYHLGMLLMILAGTMLLPLPWAWGPGPASWSALLLSALPTFAVGLILRVVGRSDVEFRRRDTFVLVTLAWILAAAAGALPYLWSGTLTSFTDAFFESMSGFTTTGSTVLTDVEAVPPGILFWRSLTQWLGGMGIMVLLVAVFSTLGVGGLQVMRAEAPGPAVERLTTRVRETARALWLMYVALTALQTLLLWGLGMSPYEALNHAFTTMATGGFGTRNASVGAFSPAIQWVITVFMFLAGVNFALYVGALQARDVRSFWRDPEFRLYTAASVGATLVVTLLLGSGAGPWPEALRHGAFQALSIMTTTGYATQDYTRWPMGAQAVLGLLSVAGACAGSTGGGIKMVRHLVLIKQAVREFARLIHPRLVSQIRLAGRAIPDEMVVHIHQFFFLYFGLLGVGFIILAATGLDLVSAMSAAAVTLGNVGPGLGVVGPVGNFSALTDTAKWTTSLLMLFGRLELYTVLVLLSPAFWRR